jgi:deoxyribodipyrimidine photolyase-related protein
MLTDEPFLWHSILSPYINSGLLDPLELCRNVEARYREGLVPLNAAEGFIRQVIGWREYVRGIYWFAGPDYVNRNALGASRQLPDFYWTGKTDMHCMAQSIGQTLDYAYAHHIQRLMITGNFALLAGINPVEVHQWYLAVYADAYEWVELPNTLGMSQFADGGMLASKPYASSGAYINRMSDYCRSCRYDVKQRTGPDACPFNALYWDFVARNAPMLRTNPRMAMPYKNWERMTGADQAALRSNAAKFLETLG